MPRTLLISGSSGFVGSHFVKFFVQQGWRVVGLDRVSPPPALKKYLSGFVVSDMADDKNVRDLIKKEKVEAVVHCAAKCLVAESVEKPDLYMDHNVTRATKFVDTLISAGVHTFLFSSTAAVYGEPKSIPIHEDHPKSPVNPYGQSKLDFERALLKHCENPNFRLGIFRYFNAAGADPEGELGESHNPETHIIPNAIRTALGQERMLSIFGNDYPTRDGTCERDYIHVWDLASAHVMLLTELLGTRTQGIFNIGTGHGYTIKEVIAEIDRQTKKPTPWKMEPRRPGDPAVLVADSTRLQRELHWKPKHSDLATMVSHALSWHRKTP